MASHTNFVRGTIAMRNYDGSVDDHGLIIVGVTWWLCFLSGCFLAVRIYTKLSRRISLWWDDWILILSWIILLASSIITQITKNMGYGKHYYDIDPTVMPAMGLQMSALSMICLFAAALSKISFGITLLRLTVGWYNRLVWFAIVSIAAATIVPAVAILAQCTPVEAVWDRRIEGQCWNKSLVMGLDIGGAVWCSLMDFVLALVPWYIIWGTPLQRKEKIGVGLAMSVGILAGLCGIIKSIYLYQLTQEDFFYDGIDVAIWSITEVAAAIIGASIPILRVLFVEKKEWKHDRSTESNQVLPPVTRDSFLEKAAVVNTTTDDGSVFGSDQ